MEAAAAPGTAASHALLPLLASPPRFLHLPPRPSGGRHGRSGDGGGLQLRQRQESGDRTRRAATCCCYMSGGGMAGDLVGGGPLVAAAVLLAALQVLWLRWCCDSLEVTC
ncbi:hypothetical protein PR202_gb07746 [Eleusine coracana subsp. coracana]|uniref:Uncharacterized protein n=1 Tax=Eleusine coracana subsp. coracana TaxID=191504 RepID=A0AAV5ED19_ELECO|nr:hypothetical protein PR202_gb07746 [Eleusine coracana subsp. coracana]